LFFVDIGCFCICYLLPMWDEATVPLTYSWLPPYRGCSKFWRFFFEKKSKFSREITRN
jgi:hypothetical protein